MDESNTWLYWGIPLFFASLWWAIFYVIARWGGWRSLAQAYPDRGIASGATFRMRSARLRAGCNYNNCITFVSNPMGLHMSMPAVFSFEHPPVFLPWSEVEVAVERHWTGSVTVLTPARCPNIAIKIRQSLADDLLPAGARASIERE